MAGQELTHEWNEVFPSAPITKNDLANPTEAFLTNALVTLLRTISINVNTSEFDPASNDQETIRKNKLCLFQYVNDMYRSLHNKKFHYFDLVHPTPKKTLNLLQTLLNYVLYYDMVEGETATDTEEMINKNRELVSKKSHLQRMCEVNKIQVQNGQESLERYSENLEEVNKAISEEKKKPCLKQFEDNLQLKSRHTQKLGGLKVHISELNSQCINEEDYLQMKSSIFEIQEALSEKQEALEKLTCNHECLCAEIANLEKKISLLETVGDMTPDGKTIAPGKLNEKKEELMRAMILYEENKKKIEEMNVQLEKGQQEVNGMAKKQTQVHESWSGKVEQMERLHEALTDQCDAVRESAEQAKQNAENSKQEIKMMLEYSKVVMNKISKSLICDVQLQDDIIH